MNEPQDGVRRVSRVPPAADDADGVLSSGGELGARMRAIDWSKTPLGPVASWPNSLKTCVRIVLTSRQPMFVWWGDDLINLYNDAYTSILGGKHPGALAKPASSVWAEIWDQVGPRAAATMRGDEGTYDEALLLIMERNGYPEETYYTFSYSPVRDERGGTGGLLCANTDDTQRITNERQIALLREQAARTLHARTVDEALAKSAEALATNRRDIPFALLYLADRAAHRLSLRGVAGIQAGAPSAPEIVAIGSGAEPWPFDRVLATGREEVVVLDGAFGDLPTGAWARPPSKAAVLPVTRVGEAGAAGVIVIGLNPFRLFDDAYRTFLRLVVGQIGASVAGAQAHEEEKRRREAIAELDRAKTAFFSNVSHEFRTPLTLMLAPIEDMRAADAQDDEQRERVELLYRNALRLLKLVNNLLDFSRIEAGRVQASYEPTDLAALTTDLASTFRSAVERCGLTFSVECAPVGDGFFVDRALWEKIVLNLLSNALKFTFEGSIAVRTRALDEGAELEVSDTGIGIPPSALPRLFERFHRVEGARSRSHEGSGIGLALVHELVGMHGGEIAVDSREGVGTTFRIRLPRGSSHIAPDRVRREPSPPTAGATASAYVEEVLRWESPATGLPNASDDEPAPPSATTSRARILVADDNADMRGYVARLLRPHWDVDTVADGRQALAEMRHRPPDLVVSDVMMPGLDGFALLRAIRTDPTLRATPFILLSARAGEEASSEGLAAGADDYVVKPFGARDLLVRVAARLAAARAARAIENERQRLYRHFMQAPFPVAILRGPELVVELANDVMLKTWGKGVAAIGVPFRQAVPEFEGQPFHDLLRSVYRSGVPYEGRAQLARLPLGPSGALEDTYWNLAYVPLSDDAGRSEGVMISAFDVTHQISATRALEAANRTKDLFLRRAAHLQATATELVRAGDTEDIARLFAAADRAAALEAFGCVILLRAGDSLKLLASTPSLRSWSPRWDGASLSANRPFAEAVLERHSIWLEDNESLEALFPTLRGRTNPDSSARALIPLLAGDESLGVFCVTFSVRHEFDPDERAYLTAVANLWGQALHRARLVEAERDAMRRALEAETSVARKKDEFMAMLGHELRNPLAPIVTATSLIRMRGRASAHELDILDRESRHLVRLVDDLLDISRITSGKVSLDRAPLDLADVVMHALERTGQGFDARRVRLYASAGQVALTVHGDRERLVQVVTNLLVNAAKFTPAGKAVHLSARVEGHEGIIEVRDEGEGIAPELLPRIFDVFTQGQQGSDRRSGGLGLGLAIARSIVTAHGGRIEASSAGPGHGSVFEVRLPLIVAAQTSPSPAPDPRGVQARPSKKRLLIVDDNRDGAEMIADYLREIGYEPLISLDAKQALSALQTCPADAALVDIGLPEMDGYELARAIARDFGPGAPKLIAMTGYAQASDRARALDSGFVEHIPKPVDLTRLATLLHGVLEPLGQG